jgi:hypothetical protein
MRYPLIEIGYHFGICRETIIDHVREKTQKRVGGENQLVLSLNLSSDISLKPFHATWLDVRSESMFLPQQCMATERQPEIVMETETGLPRANPAYSRSISQRCQSLPALADLTKKLRRTRTDPVKGRTIKGSAQSFTALVTDK